MSSLSRDEVAHVAGLARSVVMVATSERPAMECLRAAQAATARSTGTPG